MSSPLAARLGDHHLCSQHVGGNALPACAPTILVGGQPAARVDDLMDCKGPIDKIQVGEPTVLLEGKQAARFGDATVHFGLIDQGCPTVIIGKMTAEAKRMRLMERLRLIDQARKKLDSMPNGDEKSKLQAATDRLARDNKSVEHMRLADNVYHTEGAPEGWTRITGDDLPPELRNATFESGSGFYAALYRSDIDGHVVLTYRGTEMTTWQDWVLGNGQNVGLPSPQYAQAINLAKQVEAVYGDNLAISGHSLGGGLASAASMATNVPADSFNAAGINPLSYAYYGLDPFNTDQINAYRVNGEILTTAQQWTPLPNAPGNAINLPARHADGSARPNPATEAPKGWGGWAKAIINPVGEVLGRSKDQIAEAVERHSGKVTIDSMEAQKSADMATINGIL